MPTVPAPKNLGFSRQFALTVAFVGACVTVIALIGGIAFAHIDAGSLLTMVAMLGTLSAALVGSVKATESADTASKNHQLTEFTASQNASLQQLFMAHCGELCPLDNCPLRKRTEVP